MAIEDVIFGNLDNVGPNAGDIARTSWLAAGLPEAIPGVTVDRQCGSGQQAVSFAAMATMAGVNDLVVAGGVQNMSMVPMGTATVAGEALGHDDPFTGSECRRCARAEAWPTSQSSSACELELPHGAALVRHFGPRLFDCREAVARQPWPRYP